MTRRPKKATPGYVYLAYDHIRTAYKIGFTKNEVWQTMMAFKRANAGVDLAYAFCGTDHDESDLHQKFIDKWVSGEWFFLSAEDVQWIKDEFQPRNEATGRYCPGGYPGFGIGKQIDPAHIARVMSRYRPALRSSKLAEAENERLHFDRLRETYGNEYITFVK